MMAVSANDQLRPIKEVSIGFISEMKTKCDADPFDCDASASVAFLAQTRLVVFTHSVVFVASGE